LIAQTRRSQGQTLLRNQKPENQKPEVFWFLISVD